MAQLWKGRFKKELAKETNDFNSSISFDSRMFEEDIKGSIAHATMLGAAGIIDKSESDKIVDELDRILNDIKSGALQIDMEAEDIHTFIEGELTARLGQTGKRLHTARSRNDQVALDIRLTLRKEITEIEEKVKELIAVICDKAEENKTAIMPGYTHLQRAQPITFAHHIMAYAAMLCRDLSRLADAKKRMNICPLGSGALAGTTYPLNREMVAELLDVDGVTL
ncbi:MAG: argininosuccinate lyase, partial [Eubacterium sp.]|nr:argininosuccinate lyase [Eubacterium sp.]